METVQLVGQQAVGVALGGGSGGLGSSSVSNLPTQGVPLLLSKYKRTRQTSAMAAVQHGPSAEVGGLGFLASVGQVPVPTTERGHPISEVRLRFAAATAEYVRARDSHASQRFDDGPGGTVDLVMTTGGRELENLALEYGWTVEVISPSWLRAKVAEHHRRAAAYYETDEHD